MDPDAALEKLRELVKPWDNDTVHNMKNEDVLQLYCDFAEQFHALDEWLDKNAGHYPRHWD